MDDGKQYLTKEKHDELKNELDFLITTQRNEIARQLEYARSLGDLSENAEYQQARQTQGQIESRIKYLVGLLDSAEIVKKHHSSVVEIGSTVTIQKKGEKEKKELLVVGSEEADTSLGRISFLSPLGSSLMGKEKGEIFMFSTPTGKKIEYTIVSID
ncbi:MAG: transcription elongation factor GreA [Candidatus Campbellbacteria bacterium]|nr:transcription elongation factor GreA [Candidatus Campbellbacteria bacterium]